MRFSCSCLLVALVVVAPYATTAFTTPRPAHLASTSFGSRQKGVVATTTTARRMGMFEDFLSGRDTETRSVANAAYLQTLAARVDKINALEGTVEDLGDDELTAKTAEFQTRLRQGEDLNGPLLEEAFAVVREAAWCVPRHGRLVGWSCGHICRRIVV